MSLTKNWTLFCDKRNWIYRGYKNIGISFPSILLLFLSSVSATLCRLGRLQWSKPMRILMLLGSLVTKGSSTNQFMQVVPTLLWPHSQGWFARKGKKIFWNPHTMNWQNHRSTIFTPSMLPPALFSLKQTIYAISLSHSRPTSQSIWRSMISEFLSRKLKI